MWKKIFSKDAAVSTDTFLKNLIDWRNPILIKKFAGADYKVEGKLALNIENDIRKLYIALTCIALLYLPSSFSLNQLLEFFAPVSTPEELIIRLHRCNDIIDNLNKNIKSCPDELIEVLEKDKFKSLIYRAAVDQNESVNKKYYLDFVEPEQKKEFENLIRKTEDFYKAKVYGGEESTLTSELINSVMAFCKMNPMLIQNNSQIGKVTLFANLPSQLKKLLINNSMKGRLLNVFKIPHTPEAAEKWIRSNFPWERKILKDYLRHITEIPLVDTD